MIAYRAARKPMPEKAMMVRCHRVLLCVFLLAVGNTAVAGNLEKPVYFHIEAQTLGKALLEFGVQAKVQIMFAAESATLQTQTATLLGRYTARQALARLIGELPLTFIVRGNTVEIVPRTSAPPDAKVGLLPSDPPNLEDKSSKTQSGAGTDPIDEPQSGSPAESTRPHEKTVLSEIVVTGSRLPGRTKEGPQEVQIYDRLNLEQSGQNSVADFLSTLPSVSTSLPTFNALYTTTVKLRGLPVGTTLVLLDGRRVQDSGDGGGQYFDLSELPLAAVERIEVEENGASAVYGSDAIAGVVNIILRKNFNGLSASVRYGWAKDIRNVQSDVTFGREWSRGGLSIIGSYETDGELLSSERLLTVSNDYTAYGGPDNNYPDCFNANVFSESGGPLLSAPDGTATYAALVTPPTTGEPPLSKFNYGALNECSLNAGHAILPSTKRATSLVNGHLEIAPTVTLFAQLIYTNLRQVAGQGYETLLGLTEFQLFDIGAQNPFNPFGEGVGIAESLRDVPVVDNIETNFFRPLVGMKGTIARRWQWEVSAWQSADWTDNVVQNQFSDDAAIQNALNSSSSSTAINPFASGSLGSQAVLESLFSNENEESMGRDRSAEAWIRGPLMRLPGGEAMLVLGGDYVRSTIHFNTSGGIGVYSSENAVSTYHRRYSAVFGEARIPLIAGRTAASPPIAELTMSGRRDDYNDFGGDTTEQVGLMVRPVGGLLLRGTYGTAFAAPILQLLDSPQTNNNNVITDPLTGQTVIATVLGGGNPGLHPMTGRSHTIGVVYSDLSQGLLLSATQWNVVENEVTQAVGPQTIVDYASSFPGRVIRNAAGQIVEVIDTEVNFGAIDVRGVDWELSYSHGIGKARASIDARASDTYHYGQALVPGAPPIESVSSAEDNGNWAPRWKGTVGVAWTEGPISAYLDERYIGSYLDYDSTTTIGNLWITDMNVRWSVGKPPRGIGSADDGAYVELGATNLFNRAAQFSNYGFDFYGFDAAQQSIVGRMLYAHVGITW